MAASDTPALRTAGLAGGGAVATLAGLGFGTPGLVVLGVGLLVLPALSWAAVWVVARGLRVERTVEPARCVAGDHVLARWRPAGWPVRLGALHRSFDIDADLRLGTLRGGRRPARTGAREWRVGPVPRGDHPLGAPAVRVRDPLGLARRVRRAEWSGTTRVRAVPAAVPIARLALADHLPGVLGARRRAAEEAGELDRVREYRAGDPLGRIHWGHTARRGKLHTKEMRSHEATGSGVEVVLDGAVAPGGDFELAVSVTATVARHLLQRRERVGVVHTGGHRARVDAAHAAWDAVEAVLTMARPGTDTPAAEAVGAAAFRPDPPALVIVVSAGPDAALADAMARVRGAGIATAAILVAGAGGAGARALERAAVTVHVPDAGAVAHVLEGRRVAAEAGRAV